MDDGGSRGEYGAAALMAALRGMPTPPGGVPSTAPLVSGRTAAALLPAARQALGEEGARRVAARLGRAVRAATIESTPDDDHWYAEVVVSDWCEAVAAERGVGEDLRAFVRATMEQSFARQHRLLFSIATPAGIVRRASELWRSQFARGRLVAYTEPPRRAVAILHDHGFSASPTMRAVIVEILRHALSLGGARGVAASDGGGEPLVVHLEWD